MPNQISPEIKNRFSFRTFILLLLPIVLLTGVIFLFLQTGGGLNLDAPVPIENLTIERYRLDHGRIEFHVQNTGPETLTVASVIINEAVMPFEVTPSADIPRLGKAVISVQYAWTEGEAYAARIFTSNAIPFDTAIPVAFVTPQPKAKTFWGFTLIGLYVGVIPIFLGIFWLPALRMLDKQWMTFLLAITVGLLIYLGIDTLNEAFEQTTELAGTYQGIGLIGIGAVATYLLLDLVGKTGSNDRNEPSSRFSVAWKIALGIGIHNLGEGLAIGAAYNVGEIALGTFLVVGFIIQNITEGLGIIAPILKDKPSLSQLAWLGLMGGAPAILGAWIGGFAPSPFLAVLFLAIGTGAIFQVAVEIWRMVQHDNEKQPMPIQTFSGVLVGMLALWVTGILIK
ncbi:MAG: metal transporter [Anaerolineae bacterium]|nr:MAG: metal transporter [Anaerolineae bacterium]WKZ45442.1 MAG: ZIP family metal transporter [Anaerolineales bacterium]